MNVIDSSFSTRTLQSSYCSLPAHRHLSENSPSARGRRKARALKRERTRRVRRNRSSVRMTGKNQGQELLTLFPSSRASFLNSCLSFFCFWLLVPASPNLITEQPTAFHAILGITLFLFGNLIAFDPSLALEGECASPTAYWLAALDVFETGESLPSRIDPAMCDAPEDWRMAVVWGRTLVCLANVKITRSIEAAKGCSDCLRSQACFTVEDEPDWSPDSPFHAIASRRPPVTRRMTLTSASAHDLMVLAIDQLFRGILHMPRSPPSSTDASPQSMLTIGPNFSRPGELFAIASEVLGVAERLDSPEDRHRFSRWADSIFNQVLKSSSSANAEWSTRVSLSRGRCWLNMASSKMEEFEGCMERGDNTILSSPQVAETREELATGLLFC